MDGFEKIGEILSRVEPDPDTTSKSDRILFYQKQLEEIGEIVGVVGSAKRKSKKKAKMRVKNVVVEGQDT